MTSNHSNELNTHSNGGDSAHTNNNHYQNGFSKTSDSKLSGYSNSNNVNNSSSLMHKNSISSINSDHNASNGNPASSNGLHASNGTSLARNSSSSPNGSSNANQQSNNSENNENHSNNNNNNDRMPSKLVSSQLQFTNGQKDILRLIGQHLRYLGLNRTTEMLINESGCMLEHPTAANFCNLIMGGHWDEV